MAKYAWLAVLVFVGAFAGSSIYAAESTKADEEAVAKLEHEWAEAVTNHNWAWFEKNLSEDFTHVGTDGGFTNGRSAFIDLMMKTEKRTEYSISDELIRVHGSTAVGTARISIKDSKGTVVFRYTDTYAKGPDGWKAIAAQDTSAK